MRTFFTLQAVIPLIILSGLFINTPAFSEESVEIHWLDYEDARALDSDKPIFVFAEMAFCSACKKMKEDVFVVEDIAEVLNQQFLPVRMHSIGIFPNKLDDIRDENDEPLKLKGSPGFVIIKDNQYTVFYGFQSADTLRKVFARVFSSPKKAKLNDSN